MSKILIAYIPVLHAGYLALLKKYPDTVYLLGKDLILEFPRMEREIRLLEPEDIKKAILGLGIVSKIEILNKKNIAKIAKNAEIIMPNEDSMYFVAEKYFSKHKVSFEKVFLRWDKPITLRENVIDPSRMI